jgi:ankyrin repeat protein
LIIAGADLTAPGLDSGTPLHQAAWFGQPDNARLLIDAGAPLDVFDATHQSSPLGWAVHGSRYSGGAAEHQDAYVALVRMLLEAGSCLHYPNQPGSDAYFRRLLEDATSQVAKVLRRAKSN